MRAQRPDEPISQDERSGPVAISEAVLYASFAGRIRLYGRRHLGNEQAAADLVQLVLLRVIEAMRAQRIADPSRLAAYVLGTCRNTVADLRRAERRQLAIGALAALERDHIEPKASSERDVLLLMRCLELLPERDQRIVRMSFMEDRSNEEIAERMQLSAGNVRVLKHRALARLLKYMENGDRE